MSLNIYAVESRISRKQSLTRGGVLFARTGSAARQMLGRVLRGSVELPLRTRAISSMAEWCTAIPTALLAVIYCSRLSLWLQFLKPVIATERKSSKP
jgi:hypothetical protein